MKLGFFCEPFLT
jgi:hypothetical protein